MKIEDEMSFLFYKAATIDIFFKLHFAQISPSPNPNQRVVVVFRWV